jgi:sugar phosphate isomerase/epimerase
MSTITRRDWLKTTTRTAAALAVGPALTPLLAAPGDRGFKIGACEWSLQKQGPEVMKVARAIGLDGVQVNMGGVGNKMWLRQPDIQRAYLEAARTEGVAIGGLALGELNNVPLKSDARAAVWVVDAIDAAQAIGAKVILVAQFYNGELKDDRAGVDRTVAVIKEIAPRAERAGVILGLENYLSAEENLDIVQRIGSPAVQVYYDVGNSTDKGYDIYRELRLLKGQLCELHFKDAGFLFGKGRVDFAKVRAAVDDIGYRGWIQIEAAAPNGLMKDYPANLAFLRTLFPPTA